MNNLFPWATGSLKPIGAHEWIFAVYKAVVAALLNSINLAIYTATVVAVTASLWKTIG